MKIKEIILKIRQFIKKEPKLVSDLKNIALMLLFCFLFLFFFAAPIEYPMTNVPKVRMRSKMISIAGDSETL